MFGTPNRAAVTSTVALAVWFVGLTAVRDTLNDPPELNDALDYHLVAVSLMRREGFGVGLREGDATAFGYEVVPDQLANLEPGLTAARQPVFPLLLAAIYTAFGYQYWLVRIVNCIAMAAAVGIVIRTIYPSGGIRLSLATLALAILDPRLANYAGLVLTEPIATLLVALLFWALVRLQSDPRLRSAVISAILVALMILTRNIFVLWMPVLALVVFQLFRNRQPGPWIAAALFCGVTGALVSPWFMRNVIVLDAFMPSGTQGLYDLPTGYSDEAMKRLGEWHEWPYDIEPTGNRLHTERLKAEAGREIAGDWIREHPLHALALIPVKAVLSWAKGGLAQSAYAAALLFATLFWLLRGALRESPALAIAAALLVANTMAIGLTWTAFGRFLIPVLPIAHVFVGFALLVPLTMSRTSRRAR